MVLLASLAYESNDSSLLANIRLQFRRISTVSTSESEITYLEFHITSIQDPQSGRSTRVDAAHLAFEPRADSDMNIRLKTFNSTLEKVLQVAKEVAELNDIAGVVVNLLDKLRKVGSTITRRFLVVLTVC